MTTAEQSSKILRGIELSRQIKFLTDELDLLKDEFRAEAEREIKAHGTGELPGQGWAFNTEPFGHVATVSFPKIGLLQTLFFLNKIPHRYGDDPRGGREKIPIAIDCDIKEICGLAFNKLWFPFFKPAKAFSELARAMIPKPKAERLLKVLEEPPQSARVKFDVAK